MSEASPPASPGLRRAVALTTLSSVLIPVAGLMTQPILARALGVTGRGELAAALAPSALIVSVATLGLPDALTYYFAKYPTMSRSLLLKVSLATSCAGFACLFAAAAASPLLAGGDADLATLIVLAAALCIPILVVGVLRGAAAGRQMWASIATERAVNAALRVLGLVCLLALGELTVLSAVLISSLTPLVAGIVYWRLLLPPPPSGTASKARYSVPDVFSYGGRVWFGSIASMLLGQLGQILMTPLSNVRELGIYSVANTIADVPIIVALAISSAVNGVTSRSNDARKVAMASRISTLSALAGCTALALLLPFVLTPLFGSEFEVSLLPTTLLLAAAVLCVPGLMAAAGLSSAGRPGLRAAGLGITLVANISAFVFAVPLFGALGACAAGILSNIVMSVVMVAMASRVLKVPARSFLVPELEDSRLIGRTIRGVLRPGAG